MFNDLFDDTTDSPRSGSVKVPAHTRQFSLDKQRNSASLRDLNRRVAAIKYEGSM